MRATWVEILAIGLAAGCGNNTAHHLGDGGTDGPIDHADGSSVTPDAPEIGLVTLSYTSFAQPTAGEVVYFLDADSNIVLETVTDANGSASTIMKRGGSVSVLDPRADLNPDAGSSFSGELWTFAGVAPGDNLVVDGFPYHQPELDTVNLTVSIPNFAGANAFQLQTSCGIATLDGSAAAGVVLQQCHGKADMLVEAYGPDGEPLGTIFMPGVAIQNDQTINIPGPYASPVATMFSLTGATGGVRFAKGLVGPLGGDNIGDLLFFNDVVAGSGATASLPCAPSAGNSALTQIVTTGLSQSAGDDAQTIVQWGPPTDSYTLDVAPLLLDDYTAPTVDTASSSIQWTPTAGGVEPDATLAIFSVGANGRWFIIAPGGGSGTLALPQLPSDHFDLSLDGSGTTFEQFETMTITGGYEIAKQAHPWNDFDVGLPLIAPPGTSGTAVFAALQPPP